jgi:hypothetical protein
MKVSGLIPVLLVILISACSAADEQATLVANHALAGTQIAALRISATVGAARARTTLDYSSTRAALAATESRFLESTLSSRGTPIAFLDGQRQNLLGSTATATQTPAEAAITAEAMSPAAAMPTLQATPSATVPIVTPFGLVSTPAPPVTQPADPNAPRLEGFTLASGVGADDCALEARSEFDAGVAEIYIVATAVNLPAGSRVEARWYRAGAAIGPVYSFEPGSTIERACIWFYVDPGDFEFLPGEYAVDLILNGVEASPMLPFTINAP